MRPNIVFLDEYCLGGADTAPLRTLGNYTSYDFTTRDQILARCADAEIVITNKVAMRRETIAALPHLRLICIAATGTNHVDIEAATECGVVVRNAVGYSTHAVAETTIGAAIALLRQITYYDRYTKANYAGAERQFHYGRKTYQLHGSRWGIIGMGNIGREVARIASAMGCSMAYSSTSGVTREESYPALPLEELLRQSDVISIHAPLNDQTRGLIGAHELSIMKPNALLINVARGGIVNEAALAAALDAGQIAGAGLDVFAHEPMEIGNPLLSVREPERLLLSPHNAWSADESIEALIGCMVENITTPY